MPARTALSIVLAALLLTISAASAQTLTVEERIARRLAEIDQSTYEQHRRCHGDQMGKYKLLIRVRPLVAAPDLKKYDEELEAQDTRGHDEDEAFVVAERLPLDYEAGRNAYDAAMKMWDDLESRPASQQYAYFSDHAAGREGCFDNWLKVDAVRHDVARVRHMIKEHPDWVPPENQL